MRQALIYALAALGFALIAYLGVLYVRGVGPAPVPPLAGDGETLSNAEEIALLLGDIAPVGYGPAPEGVHIRRAGEGAVIALPSGAEISLSPPEGHRLDNRFVVLGPASGGFMLILPGGDRLYVSYAHAGRVMEPPSPEHGATLYAQVAERIREVGELPFLDGALSVVGVTPDPAAVYYCLARSDGLRFHGGTRFVGAVSVTVLTVGRCAETTAMIEARLALAERTLAENR